MSLKELALKAKGHRSIEKFIVLAGIDRSQWYRIVYAKHKPSIRALIKIANASDGVVKIKDLMRAAGYEDIYYAIQDELCDVCPYGL